jgi:conjugal transfer/type IV secretion protein DotA/TraY
MFFSKAKNKKPENKGGRTILGLIFNPEIGMATRPLAETAKVFVYLLAMVFATHRLFPRNHPALVGGPNAPRLTLLLVISTAWKNLTFTKESMPQVILFFAVTTIMVVATLTLFMAVLSIFVGKAHAAGVGTGGTAQVSCDYGTTGLFTPCGTVTEDIPTVWMNFLFQGVNFSTIWGDTTNQIVPNTSAIQGGLTTALALYSEAILVVAVVVLFYHLAKMVVETAHHGVVMGKKADQIWAPIRLVFAIGLLIPLGTGGTGGSGLNTGQWIVLTVAQWGSNMADQVWVGFLNALLAQTNNGLDVPNPPHAQKAVYDTFLSQTCMAAYNAYVNGWSGSTGTGGGALNDTHWQGFNPANQTNGNCTPVTPKNWNTATGAWDTPTDSTPPMDPVTTTVADKSIITFYQAKGSRVQQTVLCGSYATPAPPQSNDGIYNTIQNLIAQYRTTTFQNLTTAVQGFVGSGLQPFVTPCLGGTSGIPVALNTTPLEELVANYMADMWSNLQGLSQNAGVADALAQVAQVSANQGWVSAGAWFNTIVRLEGEVSDISSIVPATKPPSLTPIKDKFYDEQVLPLIQNFDSYLKAVDPNATWTPPTSLPGQQAQLALAEAGLQQNLQETNQNYFDRTFQLIDSVAGRNGVWQSGTSGTCTLQDGTQGNCVFHLGVTFTGNNPLADIASLGFANINTARELFDMAVRSQFKGGQENGIGASISAAGGSADNVMQAVGTLASAKGEVDSGLAQIVATLSVVFFTCGFMLAYYLPLIPFFHFLFNSLTWALSLFEAVIAIPLVALAHLNPEGDGLPGGAKQAYYFIFNIFLRPVLMIFGLIAAYLLFFIAVSYMNSLYLQAIAGSGALNNGNGSLVKLVYSVLYVLMLYMCANNCFKLISFLPENALRWMGQSGLSYGNITGDPAQIEGVMAGVGAYFDQKLVSGAMQGAQTFGKASTLIPGAAAIVTGAPEGALGGAAMGAAIGQGAMNNPDLLQHAMQTGNYDPILKKAGMGNAEIAQVHSAQTSLKSAISRMNGGSNMASAVGGFFEPSPILGMLGGGRGGNRGGNGDSNPQ